MIKIFTRIIFFLLAIFSASSSQAQQPLNGFPYNDSFKFPTSAGTVFGGSPYSAFLTASATQAAAVVPAITPDASGAGYLRLTNNSANQRGFVRNTRTFTAADGLDISFEYYSYGQGVVGADGIAFFLFNSAYNNEASFTTGGFGGSLGYAQNTTQGLGGLSGGYIGIGIDEFGNFQTNSQGRAGGIGFTAVKSAVTLRGDGDGTQNVTQAGTTTINTNYEFLTTIHTNVAASMTAIGAGTPFQIAGATNGRTAPGGSLDIEETGYRKARIRLEPNGLGTGYIVNVWIRVGGESQDRWATRMFPHLFRRHF